MLSCETLDCNDKQLDKNLDNKGGLKLLYMLFDFGKKKKKKKKKKLLTVTLPHMNSLKTEFLVGWDSRLT